MQNITGHFIKGKIHNQNSNATLPVYNPATGEEISHVVLATQDQINETVAIAKSAFNSWAQTSPNKRAQILFKFKQIIEQNTKQLAATITQEHGKTLEDSLGEITRGLEVVDFACGIPQLLKGEYSHQVGSQVNSWNFRQPLGVTVGITPFNFPCMVPMWMFPISLACGNTFILKPSEQDPNTALLLAEWLSEAGCPDGVFNVLQGDKSCVQALIDHPDVQAISFVGSTPVAQSIYQQAAKTHKKVQALGGAKNHMLVMPDVDLDQTCQHILASAFGSSGQRCMAVSVVVAIDEIADQLVEKLAPMVKELRLGHGTNPQTELAPVISKPHLEKILNYIELGEKQGAKLIVDGRNCQVSEHPNGYYLGGCLFDNVTSDMQIYQEEIFGPVLCVVRQPNFASALQLINEHPFGNGAAIYTNNGQTAHTFAEQVQVGMVGINVAIPVPVAYHSFGGWKQSLFGQSAVHGPEGVRFYTKLKTVTSRWPDQNQAPMAFAMPTLK